MCRCTDVCRTDRFPILLLSQYWRPDHLEDNFRTWPCSVQLLFILGYTTVALYRVFAGPQSGARLLLMIRWCFSRYVR